MRFGHSHIFKNTAIQDMEVQTYKLGGLISARSYVEHIYLEL